ncbi:hypothetical protein FQN55_007954 [Onygenales sp. PD_40]|nr:hypothetical protein FQN55_007954 [Onygenales sp. PD_40]KAK2803413.1 hypothetical protein FQN51_003520 [Onygenales sp. PD_10]
MAEVLAVVSGSLSVAGFALQIANNIIQISSFLSTVKSAPLEIQLLLQDIQLFNDILLEFESETPFGPEDRISKRCAEHCCRAAKMTSDLLNELQAKIGKKKLRGSLEFALKRGDLDRVLGRLESIKATVSMAHIVSQRQQQIVLTQWTKQQNDMMQAIVTHVSSNTTSLISQQSDLSTTPPSSPPFSPSSSSTPLTLDKAQHTTSEKPALRMKLPTWLGWKVCEIYASRAQIEWAFRLRTYNIIPSDSLIFKCAEDGDVDGLDNLLRSREGSVFDCGPNGATALHVSENASVQQQAPFSYALMYWTVTHKLEPMDHKYRDCALRLLSTSSDDLGRVAISTSDRTILQQIIPEHDPTFYEKSLSQRIEVLGWNHPFLGWRKPEIIPLLLTTDERTKISVYRKEILPTIVSSCAVTIDMYPGEVDGYIALLADVLRGYSHQPGDNPGPSPSLLITFLSLWMGAFPRRDTFEEYRYWLIGFKNGDDKSNLPIRILSQALYIAGVDLLQFGLREARLFTRGLVDQELRTRVARLSPDRGFSEFHFQIITIRLIAFSYGPKPEDWRCWFSNFRDEWAGEFWDMVDSTEPELPIPGSWVD